MKRRGFSLLELLVTVTVIAILAGLSMPALSSLNSSLQVGRGSQTVSDNLNLARTTALGRNKAVAVRFYKAESAEDFQSIRLILLNDDGSEEAITRTIRLPDTVVFSSNVTYSNLFGGALASRQEVLPDGMAADYVEFCFRPDGSTDLDSSQHWYVTVLLERDRNLAAPANYATFLIDPSNGMTRTYRP